ncbi:MAG TPA: DUF1579 domain-containing protein [Blastocatellia bacterium]|nr:DUF1579 domain-containing protein [Blastocatellia bacterium]
MGEWTYEAEAIMGPDKPAEKSSGTEVVRSLGGLWVQGESECELPGGGGPATMIITLGYDPQKKKFVGTFIGSMMSNLWIYEGELDATGKVLTLNSEGPDFSDPTRTAQYKDVIEMKSDDHRLMTSHGVGPDGKWMQFMTANYRRTK